MAVLPVFPDQVAIVWEQVLRKVRDRLTSNQAVDTWFRPIVAGEFGQQSVDLEVPNAFFVDWIHEHHLVVLRQSFSEVLGECPEIRFSAREPMAPPARSREEALVPAPAKRPAVSPERPADPRPKEWKESQLNPRLTFESFVVVPSNRFTHAAAMAVSERPGEVYNPLFIFGGSGLGKTHMLHAVGHSVKNAKPDARVHYVPAERFTNEMIFSIQHGQTLAFRNKYRNVDVLLIDDIQFLPGKESTQEEFFYTFNALRDAHKQIVVTADKPPKDIQKLEERLTSRFNQGLVTDIKQPDLETRLAILRKRCEEEGDGIRLADDVLLLLADRIRNN